MSNLGQRVGLALLGLGWRDRSALPVLIYDSKRVKARVNLHKKFKGFFALLSLSQFTSQVACAKSGSGSCLGSMV